MRDDKNKIINYNCRLKINTWFYYIEREEILLGTKNLVYPLIQNFLLWVLFCGENKWQIPRESLFPNDPVSV